MVICVGGELQVLPDLWFMQGFVDCKVLPIK